MKKKIALFLALIMILFSFASCSKSENPDDTKKIGAEDETVPEDTDSEDESLPPMGYNVGDLCYGAELNIVTAEGITEEKLNPVKTGKITVINFWGTWCGPCVAELPHFDQLEKTYENVNVIAIHTDSLNFTAPEFIGEHYPDSGIVFAVDAVSEAYALSLDIRGAYPATVIVDENGVIVEKIVGSATYEQLEAAVKKAMEE